MLKKLLEPIPFVGKKDAFQQESRDSGSRSSCVAKQASPKTLVAWGENDSQSM